MKNVLTIGLLSVGMLCNASDIPQTQQAIDKEALRKNLVADVRRIFHMEMGLVDPSEHAHLKSQNNQELEQALISVYQLFTHRTKLRAQRQLDLLCAQWDIPNINIDHICYDSK